MNGDTQQDPLMAMLASSQNQPSYPMGRVDDISGEAPNIGGAPAAPAPMGSGGQPSTTPSTTSGGGQSDAMQQFMQRQMQQRSQLTLPPQVHSGQLFVGGVLGLALAGIQGLKDKQRQQAIGVMSQLQNSWMKAQELSGGDQNKAKEIFHSMPEVTHILEDKKNVKQLGKLLEMDFMNPEKKKTVWHEALATVAKAGEALGLTRALQGAMQKRKDQQSQPSEAEREQQARGVADRMVAGRAETVQPGAEKLAPALLKAETERQMENLKQQHRAEMETQRQTGREHLKQMWQNFEKSPDAIKNPMMKEFALGLKAAGNGDDDEAEKHFENARKGWQSQKPASMNMNTALMRSQDPGPDGDSARKWLEDYKKLQTQLVSARGAAFGLNRPLTFMNLDTGRSEVLTTLDYRQRVAQGQNLEPVGQLPSNLFVNAERVALTAEPAFKAVEDNLGSFDNPKDRAVFAAFLKTMPAQFSDEGAFKNWLGTIALDQLSPQGQGIVQNEKVLADVLNGVRASLGMSSSEANTSMLLMLMPGSQTPNSKFARQMLQNARGYVNSLLSVPVLGGLGGSAGGAAKPTTKPAKAAAAPSGDADEVTIDLTKQPTPKR